MNLFDNIHHEMSIAPGCPWYQAQQSFGAPNVKWCERTVCSYVNEPANTWSNLGFLLVGFLIWRKFRKTDLGHFGWVVIVMGLLSAIYHATNNFLTQYFDFIGMALMTSFILAFTWRRWRPRASLATAFWFISFLNMVLFSFLHIAKLPVQDLILVNLVPMLILDLLAGFRQKNLSRYQFFALALGTLFIAQVCAQVDLKRIYCEPDNVFLHGHVLWHLLCALGMLFAARHMKRVSA